MRAQIASICLVLALGCSGGTKHEGDADTDTDPGTDPASEVATDPATDPTADPTADPVTDAVADAIPDGVEDTPEDLAADAEDDPVTEPEEDSEADPAADPSIEPYPDPRPDTSTEPRPDPSIEPYPDPRPDPSHDTGGDGACVDPCTISTVSGCGADCGGFAGTPCPHSSLTCVYPTGVTAGICIPTSALGCSTDVDCACFPSFHLCTSGTTWSCSSGSCSLSCV